MAVRSLLHYGLEVPDQAVGQRYYRDVGLADDSRGGAAVLLRPARQSRESVLLYEGPRKRLDQIPESCAWEPRDFPADDSLYVWGPPVPADFGENKEASA